MTSVIALTRLEIRRALRNRRVMFFTILYPTVLFLAIGGSANGNIGDVPAKNYILISMATFGAIGAALTNNAQKIAQERKDGWTRQLRLTALPGNGYVTGKVVAATALTVPAIVVVFAAGAATGVHLSAGKWLMAFLLLWLASLSFTALGIAIGYGVPNDSVQLVAMISYIGLSLIGGLWVPITGGIMRKVADATPTYQVRQLTTDLISGAHVPSGGVAILVVWIVAAGAVAAAVYRRGVDAG
jgi:ABC-2 type transport system permease protein